MMRDDTVAAADAMRVLAMAGDLAMGQPPGHGVRVAQLAARVADAGGAPDTTVAPLVALLRWSGSPASAAGFARLLGDDVAGRAAMLARTLPRPHPLTFANVAPLARTQCEVACFVARTLGLPAAVEEGLWHAFEHANGGGLPARLQGDRVPPAVFHVALAGDIDALSRAHGPDEALRQVARLAGRKYPADLVQRVAPHARDWQAALAPDMPDLPGIPAGADAPLALVADVLELKLPFLLGHSRRVATVAGAAATLAGLPPAQRRELERAALLHGAGRMAIPNMVWQREGRLRKVEREQVRRVPWWTARLATHVPALSDAAHLAAHVYERLDGSGYYRGLQAETLAPAHRLLAAAAAWTALRAPRPWRAAYAPAAATALLAAQHGRFDPWAVDAVIAAASVSTSTTRPPPRGLLSERETDVLRRIGRGDGAMAVGRALRISTGAVRTHLDSIRAGLECSTVPAAVLKAQALGLL